MSFSPLLAGLNVGEIFSTGGITTLLGLGMTFIVLTLLIFCVLLLRATLKGLENKYPQFREFLAKHFRKKAKVAETPSETVTEQVSEGDKTEVIDDETMQIIEEAVKSYVQQSYTDGKTHDKIKILSATKIKESDNE